MKQNIDQKNKNVMSFVNSSTDSISDSAGKIYKIGDLAREFDVTLRTLRFYEDRGLITPGRSGTTRLYTAEDRERLRIALFCKRIGLSLGDIRQVLDLHDHEGHDSNALDKIKKVYQTQLLELEKQQKAICNTIDDLRHKLSQMDSH